MLAVSPSNLPLPSQRCVLCCSLQVKLMKYICKQLQCKQKVPETERPEALDSYPHLRDWLRTINLRPELIEVGHVVLLGERRRVSSPPLLRLRMRLIYLYSVCELSVWLTYAWGMPDQRPAKCLSKKESESFLWWWWWWCSCRVATNLNFSSPKTYFTRLIWKVTRLLTTTQTGYIRFTSHKQTPLGFLKIEFPACCHLYLCEWS